MLGNSTNAHLLSNPSVISNFKGPRALSPLRLFSPGIEVFDDSFETKSHPSTGHLSVVRGKNGHLIVEDSFRYESITETHLNFANQLREKARSSHAMKTPFQRGSTQSIPSLMLLFDSVLGEPIGASVEVQVHCDGSSRVSFIDAIPFLCDTMYVGVMAGILVFMHSSMRHAPLAAALGLRDGFVIPVTPSRVIHFGIPETRFLFSTEGKEHHLDAGFNIDDIFGLPGLFASPPRAIPVTFAVMEPWYGIEKRASKLIGSLSWHIMLNFLADLVNEHHIFTRAHHDSIMSYVYARGELGEVDAKAINVLRAIVDICQWKLTCSDELVETILKRYLI